MKFKETEFKQAICSNRDYQLDDQELKFEIENKAKKWAKKEKDLEDSMSKQD
jgi:hypothetical protein